MAEENPFVRNLLGEQRKRLTGAIMSHAEQTFYDRLSVKERNEFRDKVLSGISQYHDTVLDILKSSVDDGSFMVNEEALRMITQIHAAVRKP